jgi:hypothetical protein
MITPEERQAAKDRLQVVLCPICSARDFVFQMMYTGQTCSKECARIWFVHYHDASVRVGLGV